jgi:hypothetical protein
MSESNSLSQASEIISGWVGRCFPAIYSNWEISNFQVLKSLPGGAEQEIHKDYPDFELTQRQFKSTQESPEQPIRPGGILLALMGGTKFIAYGYSKGYVDQGKRTEILLNAGDVLMFNGSLPHSGASYQSENIRIHAHLLVKGHRYLPNPTAAVLLKKHACEFIPTHQFNTVTERNKTIATVKGIQKKKSWLARRTLFSRNLFIVVAYHSEREVAIIRTNPESIVKNKLSFSELILGDDYDYSNSDSVDLEAIKIVKKSLGIPVFANGGVNTLQDADHLAEYTKTDGVMVAQGLLNNPALFGGYKSTPFECVQKFVKESLEVGTNHFVFHHHLMFMLSDSMSKAEKKNFNTIYTIPGILDFLEENYGMEF